MQSRIDRLGTPHVSQPPAIVEREDPVTDPLELRIEVFCSVGHVFGWFLAWSPLPGAGAVSSLIRAARRYRAWSRSFERQTRRARAVRARGVRLIVGGKLTAYVASPNVDVWIGPGSLEIPAGATEQPPPLVLLVQQRKRKAKEDVNGARGALSTSNDRSGQHDGERTTPPIRGVSCDRAARAPAPQKPARRKRSAGSVALVSSKRARTKA